MLAAVLRWVFVARGAVAILFGLSMLLLAPGNGLLTVIVLFGAYAFIDGIFSIVAAVRRLRQGWLPWWIPLLAGVAGVLAALIALYPPLATYRARPSVTALMLLYIIAGWAVVQGLFESAAARALRNVIEGAWLLSLSGALSLVFGIVVSIFHGAGGLAVVPWIGAYAVVLGALHLALGVALRPFTRGGPPAARFGGLDPSAR